VFRKILIANRGEISVRVIRACRELGVKTVAVYSDADREALHVRMADEAVHIGAGPSRESYLVQDRIVEAALATGAEGIHPGYGFLSENATFADKVTKAGIKFIGPSAKAMEAMGDKVSAKRNAIRAGVPVAPASDGPVDPSDAKDVVERIGLPVIVKAVHGGGGMGMRIVRRMDELEKAVADASAQAASAFGSDEVFIEKFIEDPRHIEFQIIGDEHGHVIHLGERECSIQRRNQKLLEEGPSPVMTAAMRADMGGRVAKLAKSVGYSGAGTMEFLYKDGQFYFMEMNTRLQVEHPVTELITGVDLVKTMIRVASGMPLPYKQEDIVLRGHALEVRINAEDPYHGFAPSPGKVTRYATPGGPGVRVDSGLYEGFTIPSFYDSLAVKLLSHGSNRAECIDRMRRALDEFVLEGPITNIPFHKMVVRDEAFLKGDLSTGFIGHRGIVERLEKEAKDLESAERRRAAAIAAALERLPGGGIRGYHHRQGASARAPAATEPAVSPWALAARRGL